jgi:hypothetical protein
MEVAMSVFLGFVPLAVLGLIVIAVGFWEQWVASRPDFEVGEIPPADDDDDIDLGDDRPMFRMLGVIEEEESDSCPVCGMWVGKEEICCSTKCWEEWQ